MAYHRIGRLPWGLVGAIALAVGVEAGVARHALDFSTPWATDWRISGERARCDAAGAEILCFGDSQMKFGVVPRLLESRAGGQALNLAVNVGQAPTSYFLLRRSLAAGSRPRAIVVDFTPHLLSLDPQFNTRQWPELLDFRETLSLCWTTRDGELLGSILTARLVPSLRARLEIRSSLLAALDGRVGSSFGPLTRFLRNWRVNRGAQVMPPSPGHNGSAFAGNLTDPAWRCAPANAVYLRRFLGLAASRRIPVYWLLPPFSPHAQRAREASGAQERYAEWIGGLQAEFSGLTVLDAGSSGYPDSVMIDPLHLDRRGAALLTEAVGEALAAGSTGWTRLPRFVDRAADAGLEDTGESAAWLETRGRVRR